MPILPPVSGLGGPDGANCKGMTRSDVIELANQLTERKAEKILSLPLLFAHVLQDFCGRNRYWWRNYYATFNTAPNVQDYDMTDAAVFTPDLSEIGVEEITQVGIIQGGVTPPIAFLTPVFDPQTVIEMRSGINQNGTATPGTPSRYTVDANSYNQLLLDLPNGVYSMAVTFWAMPNPKKDSVTDCIPLVPPWHHKALVAGLVSLIWKRVEGIGSKEYITSKQEYEDYIVLAQARPRFTTNYSQQLIQSDHAIRST